MKQLRTLVLPGLVVLVGCADEEQISPTAVEAGFETVGSLESVEMPGEFGHVTGSAHLQVFAANGLGLRKLTFNGIRHADGRVSGQWNIVAGASIIHGEIDCLNILPGGQVASLSGVVNSAKFTSFEPGTAFAIEVRDEGSGEDENLEHPGVPQPRARSRTPVLRDGPGPGRVGDGGESVRQSDHPFGQVGLPLGGH